MTLMRLSLRRIRVMRLYFEHKSRLTEAEYHSAKDERKKGVGAILSQFPAISSILPAIPSILSLYLGKFISYS